MSTVRGGASPRMPPRPHPPWLLFLLVAPVAGWVAVATLTTIDVEQHLFRRVCRDLGYVVLLILLLAYLYPWRRLQLHRSWGRLATWLRWHIAAGYLAFGLMVVHARGRLWHGGLTLWIVLLFALVLLSGALGMALRKLVYRLLPFMVECELAGERLEFERRSLADQATDLIENYSLLLPHHVSDWTAFCQAIRQEDSVLERLILEKTELRRNAREAILRLGRVDGRQPHDEDAREVTAALNDLLALPVFYQAKDIDPATATTELLQLNKRGHKDLSPRELERRNRLFLEAAGGGLVRPSHKPDPNVVQFFTGQVDHYLRSPFPGWGWLFGAAALEPVERNHYLRALALASPEQQAVVNELWQWVERRRRMDLEFWLRRVANCWLKPHAVLAWLLFVLVLLHAWSSIRYGGLF